VEQLTSQNHPIIMGSNTLIPGFEDKITGIKTSEERKFKLKFPKEHFAPQFRGKEFRFEVKADKVQEVVLPKIDEDFVKKFGLKSVEGLKKRLKANIAEEKKERYETQARDEVTKALTQMTRVELPAALVEAVHEVQKEFLQRISDAPLTECPECGLAVAETGPPCPRCGKAVFGENENCPDCSP